LNSQLENLIEDILCGGGHYLGGIHNKSASLSDLLSAVVQWAMAVKKDLSEVVAGIEPCIRQSVFMSLLPADALDPSFPGSIDRAVEEHLAALRINVSVEGRLALRDACINARRLYGLNKREARNQTASIAQLRGDTRLYNLIDSRQGGRCLWCGVLLNSPSVIMTLDHVTPKHLGDDNPDGRNWAISCTSCNEGKGDSLAWSARPEAHDFIGRNEISATSTIGLKHRWSVLMRERECEYCEASTAVAELWVYRRITTGLPVPVNCGTTCENCAVSRRLEILAPSWVSKEAGRGRLQV
jgi:hypothetical protein